ncbi:hypothetical protein K505DRAFT_368463 [Melanomma pulvis-pyrius CBS 109.77]|uniref:Mitochondrial outer membrane protein n=1 Tax=Melanomma pulvis-pyrius CBS 109.77 TaxID=1314802 RepID=A0A6A6WQD1_9PLEO|nr:hypothetical protein K505DRAFT_368463 [Melanomma pulvis-pyrius CBS 109.77]
MVPNIFSVPAPIRQLFDKFPLLTYPSNDLPHRAHLDGHVLYVFASEDGAAAGAPSYNPACLKWQTYLKFSNVDFRLVSSNNHASPSGALPFLLPSTDSSKAVKPIPSGKLQRWAMDKSSEAIEEPSDSRYEAYLSLLDHRIRRAWIYSIYLSPNSTSIAEPLYVLPTSNNSFVRLSIAHGLRRAAENELLKFSAVINAESLYREAEDALVALEMLLGTDKWFFGASNPSLFDASVFAYTHLLMDRRMDWVETRLPDAALQHKTLVKHRDRILSAYFPSM